MGIAPDRQSSRVAGADADMADAHDRPVQYFSEEQLALGRKMSPEQILQFLEEFRLLHGARLSKTRGGPP